MAPPANQSDLCLLGALLTSTPQSLGKFVRQRREAKQQPDADDQKHPDGTVVAGDQIWIVPRLGTSTGLDKDARNP